MLSANNPLALESMTIKIVDEISASGIEPTGYRFKGVKI